VQLHVAWRQWPLFAACALLLSPVSAAADEPDVAAAVGALAEFDAACERVEPLWSVPLCGPVVLVDPGTRMAVTNRPDPNRAFIAFESAWSGHLPDEIPIANTALEWGSERWAMAMLPLPSDSFQRLQLLAHESFHRIQADLGHEPRDSLAPHLDEEMARVWLRLELRALARAVAEDGPTALEAASDALLFRAARHRVYSGAADLEARLEWHEGLAEYTGVRFAMDATGERQSRMQDLTARFERRPTYVRSLGYGTGPLLGLLLDRYDPRWREHDGPHDLAARLATALPASARGADLDVAWRRAEGYGVAALRAEEAARAARIAALRERYRRDLVDGPVLQVALPDRHLRFNPNTVMALGDVGSVYPGAILVGPWGRLTLHDGAALAPDDRTRARVVAPETLEPHPDGTLEGPGWTLELNPGWQLVPGERSGDVRIAPIDV
jgi:hypothetical protein